MKKWLNLMVCVVLTICMSVSVMAAQPSPGTDVRPEEGEVVLEDGTILDITDPDELGKYIIVTKPSREPEQIPGNSTLKVFDVIVSDNVSSASVVLHVPGVKVGDTVIVRMFVDGKWVEVEAEVIADNKIRINVTGSATFAIYKKDSAGGQTGGETEGTEGNEGSNTSSTSPKTGETSAVPAAYAAFAVLAVIAVLSGYKAKKES